MSTFCVPGTGPGMGAGDTQKVRRCSLGAHLPVGKLKGMARVWWSPSSTGREVATLVHLGLDVGC